MQDKVSRRKRRAPQGYQVVPIDGIWLCIRAVYSHSGVLSTIEIAPNYNENGENTGPFIGFSRNEALEYIKIVEITRLQRENAQQRKKIQEMEEQLRGVQFAQAS